MPDKPKPQLPAKRELTALDCVSTPQWKVEVQKVIPKEIALEAMLRVARSAASEAKFAMVDPRSFLLALLKCGRAGLYPDGREAHLIPFGKEVQAIFDWKGLVALANRAGIMVTAKLVYENDHFDVQEDDGTGKTTVLHVVNYRRPRGELQAVYSRAVRADGKVDYEIMTAEEVEAVRQHYSRAKDSTPWKNSFGEMMKKTAIKRHSKRWDMSPEIRQAMNADDDTAPPIEEVKPPVKPIFKTPAPAPVVDAGAVEGVSESPEPDKSSPAPASAQGEALHDVLNRCKKAGILPYQLTEFLQVIGLGEEGQELGEILDTNDTAYGMIVENWEEFSSRIKEAV